MAGARRQLNLRFALTTAAREMVSRFVQELEAQERRITRLRRASKLPPSKTFDTLDEARLPPALVRRLQSSGVVVTP